MKKHFDTSKILRKGARSQVAQKNKTNPKKKFLEFQAQSPFIGNVRQDRKSRKGGKQSRGKEKVNTESDVVPMRTELLSKTGVNREEDEFRGCQRKGRRGKLTEKGAEEEGADKDARRTPSLKRPVASNGRERGRRKIWKQRGKECQGKAVSERKNGRKPLKLALKRGETVVVRRGGLERGGGR